VAPQAAQAQHYHGNNCAPGYQSRYAPGYGGYNSYYNQGYGNNYNRGYGNSYYNSGYGGYGRQPAIVQPEYLHWTPGRGLHTHGQIVVPHGNHYHVRPY
jgi:hypothetical protein